MRKSVVLVALVLGLITAPRVPAQGPGGGPGPGNQLDDLIVRMFEFDANGDGKLTRAEVTDQRLLGLFDRADADKNGSVTRAELRTLAAAELAKDRARGPGFGPPGGGFGGPMMGPPPRPGEVLPAVLQQRLKLTPEQRTQVQALQSEVDRKLNEILTADQRDQFRQMRERGPRGFGPPPGGPPGGPPPGDGPLPGR